MLMPPPFHVTEFITLLRARFHYRRHVEYIYSHYASIYQRALMRAMINITLFGKKRILQQEHDA